MHPDRMAHDAHVPYVHLCAARCRLGERADRKLTADQAGAALERCLAHEKGTARTLFDPVHRHQRRASKTLVESGENASRTVGLCCNFAMCPRSSAG